MPSLQKITQRIIRGYQPDRIILFGSRSAGRARKDSDLDLLIIKETEKGPVERRVEVETILSDREYPLDLLVYTPGEVRTLYQLGTPLIQEIMEKGKVLYMRKATEAWIREAREEWEVARLLLRNAKLRAALYHAQQSVEKGLKAILIEQGRKPARTHDLVELLNQVHKQGIDTNLALDDIVFLNSIYQGRYPTEEGLLPHGEPTRADAEKGVACAKKLAARLKKMTPAANSAPDDGRQ